jgi:hypothetical protein
MGVWLNPACGGRHLEIRIWDSMNVNAMFSAFVHCLEEHGGLPGVTIGPL